MVQPLPLRWWCRLLWQYTVRLVLYPDCYVTLKRPVSVATGAGVFDSTAASPSVRTIQVAPQPQEKDTGAGFKVGTCRVLRMRIEAPVGSRAGA